MQQQGLDYYTDIGVPRQRVQHDFTHEPFIQTNLGAMDMTERYSRRASFTRPYVESQDWPEKEGWYQQYSIPFKPKRAADYSSNSQNYPAKRSRIWLEDPSLQGRQKEYNTGINQNTNAQSHLSMISAPQYISVQSYEQPHYKPVSPPFIGEQPMNRPRPQMTVKSNLTHYTSHDHSRAHFVNSHNFNTEIIQTSGPRSSSHSQNTPDFQRSENRSSLSKPFRPAQSNSGQPFQHQKSQYIPGSGRFSSQQTSNGGGGSIRAKSMAPERQGTNAQSQRASSVAPSHGHANGLYGMSIEYKNMPLPISSQTPVQHRLSGAKSSEHTTEISANECIYTHNLSNNNNCKPANHARPEAVVSAEVVSAVSSSQPLIHTPLQTDIKHQHGMGLDIDNMPKNRPAANRNGPFIIDDDDNDEFVQHERFQNSPPIPRINVPTVGQPSEVPQNNLQAELVSNSFQLNVKVIPDIDSAEGSNIAEGGQTTADMALDQTENIELHSDMATSTCAAPAVEPLLPQPQHSIIDFSKGRRGVHSLAHDLEESKCGGEIGDATVENQTRKPHDKKSKAIGNLEVKNKLTKEAAAFAKIKEKEGIAAKMRDTDSLFQDPINDAAQARLDDIKRKEEQRKLEIDIKKRHKQAMEEEIEKTKKEAAERAQAEKENEMALKKYKTQAEREAIQKAREEEDKKRAKQQQQKAEELLLKKRKEQLERETAAIEREAEAESKRQQDAENLKKALEASRLAAASLKPARKKHDGTLEDGADKVIDAVEVIEIFDDESDEGLFVPEKVDDEASDTTKGSDKGVASVPRDRSQHWPLTPLSPLKRDNTSKVRKEPSNLEPRAFQTKDKAEKEPLSLRALAGWRGARRADFETKTVSVVIQQQMEKLIADQKLHEEASARERAREKLQTKKEITALFKEFGSSVIGKVQGEVKVVVERALKQRPSTATVNEKSQIDPVRHITAVQQKQKYASEIQWLLNQPATKQRKDPTHVIEPAQVIESAKGQNEGRREKDEIRLANKARKRFEVKLRKDNAEQSRPMSAYEFSALVERHMKDWREKRGKILERRKRMMPHVSENSQPQDRFGYEDVDFISKNSMVPNKPNEKCEKGQSGGIMARMRESNNSLGSFKVAAATKIVDDAINQSERYTDSESEVSEEDPDDDDEQIQPPQPTQLSNTQKNVSDTSEIIAPSRARSIQSSSSESDAGPLSKPRHLQDKEMVYVFSVQRSEMRSQLKSQPVIIKQFLDRNDANEFAEEELKQTRWGPSVYRPQITQSYSKDMGLFNGVAIIESEENIVEYVDVVALAQYIGDLDHSENRKVKAIFKPKLYFILKSTTKMTQNISTPNDDDATENEEVAKNDGEKSDTNENNCPRGSDADERDSLFDADGEDEEPDNSNHDLVSNARRSSLASDVPCGTPSKVMLKQTCKTLEVYTDRELANKRASEIFLNEVKPVGGDVAQLAEYENETVKQIREHLETYSISGELFSASYQLSIDGEELTVWVEDFQLGGPLN